MVRWARVRDPAGGNMEDFFSLPPSPSQPKWPSPDPFPTIARRPALCLRPSFPPSVAFSAKVVKSRRPDSFPTMARRPALYHNLAWPRVGRSTFFYYCSARSTLLLGLNLYHFPTIAANPFTGFSFFTAQKRRDESAPKKAPPLHPFTLDA